MKKNLKIVSVRSNHEGQFEKAFFKNYFGANDISHNFSCPRTPQQSGFMEKKNRSLQEMARKVISESGK